MSIMQKILFYFEIAGIIFLFLYVILWSVIIPGRQGIAPTHDDDIRLNYRPPLTPQIHPYI